jgi:two-component system, cell cycle response regulator
MTRPAHLLVVDDSTVTRTVLRRRLERAGYIILEACDGEEGARLALQDRPSLVITDVEMPALDGFQLTRFLKAEPETSSIPVVILTTHEEGTSRYWGRHTGADAYITKDAGDDVLLEVVRRLLANAGPAAKSPSAGSAPSQDIVARVVRQLDDRLLQVTIINDVLEAGLSAASVKDAADRLLAHFSELLDTPRVAVAIIEDEAATVFVRRDVAGDNTDGLGTFLSSQLGRSGYLFASLEVTVIASVGGCSDESAANLEPELFHLPLRDAAGVLLLWPSSRPRRADAFSKLLGDTLPHAAVALDNARLADRLRRLSAVDDLTRVASRRAILSRLAEELERAQRYGTKLSIILCDIDHFKRINDTYGHLVGDEVLRQVAQVLLSGCRSADLVGRYGGEEFLLLLPHTALERAVSTARRLQEKLACGDMIEAADPDLIVTASFGVACDEEVETTRAVDALLSLADERLYEAKGAGRNRVMP